MASDTVLEITDANFQSEVLDSEHPVLVDFWAEWCMPCRMLAPVIDELSQEYEGKVKVGKVDTDANREIHGESRSSCARNRNRVDKKTSCHDSFGHGNARRRHFPEAPDGNS